MIYAKDIDFFTKYSELSFQDVHFLGHAQKKKKKIYRTEIKCISFIFVNLDSFSCSFTSISFFYKCNKLNSLNNIMIPQEGFVLLSKLIYYVSRFRNNTIYMCTCCLTLFCKLQDSMSTVMIMAVDVCFSNRTPDDQQ